MTCLRYSENKLFCQDSSSCFFCGKVKGRCRNSASQTSLNSRSVRKLRTFQQTYKVASILRAENPFEQFPAHLKFLEFSQFILKNGNVFNCSENPMRKTKVKVQNLFLWALGKIGKLQKRKPEGSSWWPELFSYSYLSSLVQISDRNQYKKSPKLFFIYSFLH